MLTVNRILPFSTSGHCSRCSGAGADFPSKIRESLTRAGTDDNLWRYLMKFIARQKGDRRWDLPHEFPLVDSQGVLVRAERRKLADRRRNLGDFQDLVAVLSRMLPDRAE
jgi:hypothetical protein